MSLIEKLKHNEKPYGLNSKEEQECFEKTGLENCQIQADYSIKWFDCKQIGIEHFGTAGKFRIKPDYQPEPQTEKCEVKALAEGIFYERDRYCRKIHEALSDPDFSQFLDKDGNPMKIRGDYDLHCNHGKPAPIPKWVVFKVQE